jgi:hypothetical protein
MESIVNVHAPEGVKAHIVYPFMVGDVSDTDTAFSLGILSLLGQRGPLSPEDVSGVARDY